MKIRITNSTIQLVPQNVLKIDDVLRNTPSGQMHMMFQTASLTWNVIWRWQEGVCLRVLCVFLYSTT